MNAIDVSSLLGRTSRTFALALPLLPPRIDEEASLAYLLFRTIDTVEDGPEWTAPEKAAALVAIEHHLASPTREEAERLASAWLARPPASDANSADLLAAYPSLVQAILELRPPAPGLIFAHARRTALGMHRYLAREGERDGEGGEAFALRDLDDLRGYCYAVAGIVGELLTELFFLHAPPPPAAEAATLRTLAPRFGEALQLVNVLRDERTDLAAGRRLVPARTHAAATRLAAEDLALAGRYVEALSAIGAPAGIRRFSTFLVRLAAGTLDAVARQGPGARVSRSWVFEVLSEVRFTGGLDPESPLHA
jgi:farnesyl-diphosphate farnesyltransferase